MYVVFLSEDTGR